jgi:SAM-dependent methyltransferase
MKREVANILKRLLPQRLTALRKNCGGRNRNTGLFSANLLQQGISTEQYLQIAGALIFRNGVRKSTHEGRNAPVISSILNRLNLSFRGPVKVLDIGASLGLDATGNLEAIEKHFPIVSYTLGDLYTELLYDPEQKLVFDQDENLLQILFYNHFVNLNFEFKYSFQRIVQCRNRKYTRRIARTYKKVKPIKTQIVKIPLIHPSVGANPKFSAERMDVFNPLKEQYDLIICMNLLQPRYFSGRMVQKGIDNLTSALRPGGALITGVTDRPRIFADGKEITLR